MITQIIITQIQEMMNWSFGGAVAMLLLVTTLLVFYLYDRALGNGSKLKLARGVNQQWTNGGLFYAPPF